MTRRFDPLIAAILPDPERRDWRVRWDVATQTWRGIDARDHGIDDAPRPPLPDDIEAAETLLDQMKRSACIRCGLPNVDMHAIVADLLGRPSRACLQVPDLLVVHSAGQGGRRKHDATTNCHHLEGGATWFAEAIYARGKPLTLFQSLSFKWCATCVTDAKLTHKTIRIQLGRALGRVPTEQEIASIEANRRYQFMAEELMNLALTTSPRTLLLAPPSAARTPRTSSASTRR